MAGFSPGLCRVWESSPFRHSNSLLARCLYSGVGVGWLIRYSSQAHRPWLLLLAPATGIGLLCSPFQAALQSAITVLESAAHSGSGLSIELYLLGVGLDLLSSYFFLRGLLHPLGN
ncbi:MAG TPA: hypothetical protein V6C99_09190 [Oculatellaceae cyanobacterium]|jgi:hypothetical protein